MGGSLRGVSAAIAQEVAQLARAFLGALDRRPVAAAGEHHDARALACVSAIARTACGGATPSSSPVTSSAGASMRSTRGGLRVGQRLAAARIALPGLAASGFRARRPRPAAGAAACRPKWLHCTSASAISCMPAVPSSRAFSPRARMSPRAASGGAISGPNRARLRTSDGLRQPPGAGTRCCPSSGRAKWARVMSSRAHTACTASTMLLDRQRPPASPHASGRCPGRSMRTTRWRGERSHQRRQGVGAAAQPVHADDGVAFAFVLHGQLVDQLEAHVARGRQSSSKRFSMAPMPSISMRTTSPWPQPLRRLEAHAHARRRAGGDDVAG